MRGSAVCMPRRGPEKLTLPPPPSQASASGTGEIHAYRFSCPVNSTLPWSFQPARMDAIPQVCDWAHTYWRALGTETLLTCQSDFWRDPGFELPAGPLLLSGSATSWFPCNFKNMGAWGRGREGKADVRFHRGREQKGNQAAIASSSHRDSNSEGPHRVFTLLTSQQ